MAEESSLGFDRIPPHSFEAETSVLGSMILTESAVATAQEMLNPEDFYKEAHRKIFKALIDLYSQGSSTDPVVLVEELKRRGILEAVGDKNYIHILLDSVPNPHSVKHYAQIVRDMSFRRNMIDIGHGISNLGYQASDGVEEVYDKAEDSLFQLGQRMHRKGLTHIRNPLLESFDRMSEAKERGSRITGLSTGFHDLDRLTSGLQPSNLIIIGGRTSMGKTSMALNIAHHVSVYLGVGVLIFSLEMSEVEVTERLLLCEARIDSARYRVGDMNEKDMESVVNAAGVLRNAPIWIDDTGDITLSELRTISRQLMAKENIGLIIVDYIQLMYSGKADTRAQEVSRISRDLKVTATDLKVPVLAVSQLRRPPPTVAQKKPTLEDLKESGGIEQSADLVILIYRPEVDDPTNLDVKGLAEINLAKHRNGKTGKFKLYWMASYSKFDNPAEEDLLVE